MLEFPTGFVSPKRTSAQRWSRVVFLHREPNAMQVRKDERTIRAVMTDGQEITPSAYTTAHLFNTESIIGEEALYTSAKKCWKGVGQKFSAQAYILGIIEKTINLSRQLRNGTYKEGKTHIVQIEYPKKRTAISITFRDRVFQRSLNDTTLYPQMVRPFIYANYACQKGKGTDAAVFAFKAMLHRAYIKYGSNDFRILSCDVEHYYDNMVHAVTDRLFAKYCDPWTAKIASATLAHQYKGDRGYNPGSQMVQIAGISYLNQLDHTIKERFGIKLYIRYMDDFHAIVRSESEAEQLKLKISGVLEDVGLKLHPEKTVIRKAEDGVLFLGYLFKVLKSGKVLMLRDPKRVKENRRKLRRLAKKVIKGEREIDDFEKSYECIRACIAKGNSNRLLHNMDDFVNSLKEEINATIQQSGT